MQGPGLKQMPNRLRQLEADGVISYYRNINQKTESKCKVSLQLFKHYKREDTVVI